MTTLCVLALIGFGSSLILTPTMRWLSRRFGLVDRPDAVRKIHKAPIPLGGGVAIFLSVLTATIVVLFLPNPLQGNYDDRSTFLWAFLGASIVIVLVGLIDDLRPIRGRHKLLGQIAAVSILVWSGLEVRHVAILGMEVDLGVLAIPFTYFWLLGAINAFNLIDGIDGFATTVGLIFSMAIAMMALLTKHYAEAAIATALFGALLGFMRFNFPPATIYLGDAGSMLIGLLTGTLAMSASLKGPATVALAAPMAVWAIPIFDSSMAILRRKLTGRSVYSTDRGHIHHCLLRFGISHRGTLAATAVICSLTAAGALAGLVLKNETLAIIAALTVTGTLVATGIFGRAELMLVVNQFRGTAKSFGTNGNGEQRHEVKVRLQGCQNWDELWSVLVKHAEILELSSVRLDLNLPFLHEGYHAYWKRADGLHDDDDRWQSHVPLFYNDQRVGKLEVTCDWQRCGAHARTGRLIELFQSVEQQLVSLVNRSCQAAAQNEVIRLDPPEKIKAGKARLFGLRTVEGV